MRDLSIKISNLTPEDQFAAAELSASLSRRAGSDIRVLTSESVGPSIALVRTGSVDALPGSDDRPGPESREAYEIRIDQRGAEIRARSSAGIFYGIQTMRQLVEGSDGQAFLPEVSIKDWPALAYRGFMMDTSHGPFPTEAEINRQIDFLSRWKANQYYLYSEAGIELPGYDLVNPDARYTQEQIRRIIGYARARHIDVVPTVELYGHLHDLFRIERYADLSLLPHSGEINPRNQRTQALIADWIQQLASLFASPWFHIGFDEPWELERSQTVLGVADPSSLYVERLKQTVDLVEKSGRRPMFWADVKVGAFIFQRYPGLLSQLPKTVIAVPWHYRPLPDYSDIVAPFTREHIQQVVAPSIWCWNEIAPDYTISFANIDGLVADGRKFGALGVMNTGWTDSGQVLYRAALPGMAYGAVASWQTAPLNHRQFFSDYATQMYPRHVAGEVAAAIEKLSAAQSLLARTVGERTITQIWEDPFAARALDRAKAGRETLRQERLLAEEAQSNLQRALASTPQDYSLPSLLVAARMLDYCGMKYLYAAEMAQYFESAGKDPDISFLMRQTSVVDHGRIPDLLDLLTATREKYRSAWRDEYTDYRLARELGRWGLEYEYWTRLEMRLDDLYRDYQKGDRLPSLDELRPHF